MKKKQLLFLFAAALFAACSSDELPTDNQGSDDNSQTAIENLPSSVTVTTEDGFGMTVGATGSTKAATRADSESDYFTLSLPDDILGEWEGYVAKADDFYITRTINSNKEVLAVSTDGTEASLGEFKVTRNEDLTVTIDNIHQTREYTTDEPKEYTFEVYIWIKNQWEKPQSSGDGVSNIIVEDFSYAQKLAWIGLTEGSTITEKTERGKDFTAEITSEDYQLVKNITSLTGINTGKNYYYAIRYNVYRGLQGNPTLEDGETVDKDKGLGNTPYIKVSIHVVRWNNPNYADEEGIYPVLPKD